MRTPLTYVVWAGVSLAGSALLAAQARGPVGRAGFTSPPPTMVEGQPIDSGQGRTTRRERPGNSFASITDAC